MDWTAHVSPFVLERPRLQAVLDEAIPSASQRLLLITAPAGYGKTTLLWRWVQSSQEVAPTAILVRPEQTVDGEDRAVVTPLRGDVVVADYVSSLVELLSSPGSEGVAQAIDTSRSALFDRVAQLDGPCVIVIDDLDRLPVSVRRFLLEGLLANARSPRDLSVVAAGRAPSHHALGRLAAAGRLRQMFGRDLALSAAETRELLALRGESELAEPALTAVMDATLGWPAGVALAGHLIASVGEPGQWLPLDDYVATTMLSRLGDATRQVLFVVATLPWIDRELWQELGDAMPGTVDSFDALRSTVPLTCGGVGTDGRRTYVLAPLLRDALVRIRAAVTEVSDTERFCASDGTALVGTAIQWLMARDLFQHAIAVARVAEHWSLILASLRRTCREFAIRDNHAAIIAHLSALPDARLLADDDLAFWYVLSLMSIGDVSEGTRLHALVAEAWRGCDDPMRRGRLDVLNTLLAIWRGDRELALSRARAALSDLPPDAYHERMRAAASADVLAGHLGQRELSVEMFAAARAARDHLPWDQRWWVTFVLPNQADRAALEGRLSSSAKLFQHLIDSYAGVFPEQMALMHMRLALIDLERGDPEAALRRMDLADSTSVGYWTPEVPLARAKILHALGRDDEAIALLYAAIRAANSDLNEIDVRRSRTVLAQLWIDRGEIDITDAWAALECNAIDTWPRSFGQTPPGAVLAHLAIIHGRCAEAIELLDALIVEGEARFQPAPLVHVYALKAIAYARGGNAGACHDAIRRAIDLGGPEGFHHSYMVGTLDTRLLLGVADRTLETALAFAPPPAAHGTVKLTRRETDILRQVMKGKTNIEIAKHLFLSPITVKNHLGRVYQKLGVRGRDEAVVAARSQKLI
ncbi:MAG: LuxR C-terminal-related transcriptional regulator [Thermomicrobiales bacterium]